MEFSSDPRRCRAFHETLPRKNPESLRAKPFRSKTWKKSERPSSPPSAGDEIPTNAAASFPRLMSSVRSNRFTWVILRKAWVTVETPTRTRAAIAGEPERGPLLVDEYDTTVVVRPGWTVRREPTTSTLILEREQT